MTDILHLQSEEALHAYLKRFLKEKPQASQLSWANEGKAHSNVVLVFRYSVNGKKYKLLGDVPRKAIESFVKLADEHGSAAVVLKEYSKGGEGTESLILATEKSPQGWVCHPWSNKTSDRLHKAA